MLHDYTLTKLAEAHVRELHTEKRAHDLMNTRRPQGGQYRATSNDRTATSLRKTPDTAGACR